MGPENKPKIVRSRLSFKEKVVVSEMITKETRYGKCQVSDEAIAKQAAEDLKKKVAGFTVASIRKALGIKPLREKHGRKHMSKVGIIAVLQLHEARIISLEEQIRAITNK